MSGWEAVGRWMDGWSYGWIGRDILPPLILLKAVQKRRNPFEECVRYAARQQQRGGVLQTDVAFST